MQLISQPADPSPLFGENLFVFEGADAATSTEIAFHLADGTLLGARRYAGRGSIATSPNAYVNRTLHPVPHHFDRSTIERAEGRDVELYVAYNNGADRSSAILFTASHDNLSFGSAMGPNDTRRIISPGEWDEISILAPRGARLELTAVLSDGTTPILLSSRVTPERGVWLVSVVADVILAFSSTPADVEWFDVNVSSGGSLLTTVRYHLEEAPRDAVRLAWLNPRGYISYHTFRGSATEQVASRRTEAPSYEGTTTLSLDGWRELKLVSTPLPRSEVARVGEVATSPRVWRIYPDGTAVPHTLLSGAVRSLGPSAHTVELTLRPSKTTTYW